MTAQIEDEIEKARQARFDIDEDTDVDFNAPPPPRGPLTLEDLKLVLADPALYPPEVDAAPLSANEKSYEMLGLPHAVRVTTDPRFYEEHPDSVELWSPGGAVFPKPVDYTESSGAKSIGEILRKFRDK